MKDLFVYELQQLWKKKSTYIFMVLMVFIAIATTAFSKYLANLVFAVISSIEYVIEYERPLMYAQYSPSDMSEVFIMFQIVSIISCNLLMNIFMVRYACDGYISHHRQTMISWGATKIQYYYARYLAGLSVIGALQLIGSFIFLLYGLICGWEREGILSVLVIDTVGSLSVGIFLATFFYIFSIVYRQSGLAIIMGCLGLLCLPVFVWSLLNLVRNEEIFWSLLSIFLFPVSATSDEYGAIHGLALVLCRLLLTLFLLGIGHCIANKQSETIE